MDEYLELDLFLYHSMSWLSMPPDPDNFLSHHLGRSIGWLLSIVGVNAASVIASIVAAPRQIVVLNNWERAIQDLIWGGPSFANVFSRGWSTQLGL